MNLLTVLLQAQAGGLFLPYYDGSIFAIMYFS